ncbi:MAG: V-type ATP synthase subunit A [Hyphomicrobiaceae bacterium]|nr:MAG: V-type ATP synthase subunit A [Hyphomicrobiaceae bacterium]
MSEAVISSIGGPVLRARATGPFHVGEAIAVGPARLPGEVIRLKGSELVAQVYEDTTGLRPGDPVHGSGRALSVSLGPSLLGRIFDGLLRPLDQPTDAVRGVEQTPRRIAFKPLSKVGEHRAGGSIVGALGEGRIGQLCLMPPGIGGLVESIVPEGSYPEDAVLCVIRTPLGDSLEIGFTQFWPVRQPRPVAERLPPNEPLVTGQRILDTLFPVARGGRAALPGGFGTGKTVLQETLAKWCDADVIVYVGCGERGNEMAEVLDELPQLSDPRTGRKLMERTVIIANTSNMAVAAREASIYTAVTVGEYFRDQGLHVALMADSTSRWAEALREVAGRLGELPGEAGYPAYLGSRLAEFYERAARVRTLAGGTGSLTIIGAISPAAGDFSEPVTSHTKRFVSTFWGLDRERAQARFYPAVHPLQSYSDAAARLASWWMAHGNAQWLADRERLLTILESQANLERMARIVGKDALPPAQQLTLICAELINEALLRQSAFSETDRYCSPARQTAMLRLVLRFIDAAERALARNVRPEAIAALPVLRRLKRMGEEIGEGLPERFDELHRLLDEDLARVEKEAEHAT